MKTIPNSILFSFIFTNVELGNVYQMPLNYYYYALISGVVLGGINSWIWYKNGYRGGRLFFLSSIAFFALFIIIFKIFAPSS